MLPAQLRTPVATCSTCGARCPCVSRWADACTPRERLVTFCDGCDPHDNVRTCAACESARVRDIDEICSGCDARIDGVAANGVWR